MKKLNIALLLIVSSTLSLSAASRPRPVVVPAPKGDVEVKETGNIEVKGTGAKELMPGESDSLQRPMAPVSNVAVETVIKGTGAEPISLGGNDINAQRPVMPIEQGVPATAVKNSENVPSAGPDNPNFVQVKSSGVKNTVAPDNLAAELLINNALNMKNTNPEEAYVQGVADAGYFMAIDKEFSRNDEKERGSSSLYNNDGNNRLFGYEGMRDDLGRSNYDDTRSSYSSNSDL